MASIEILNRDPQAEATLEGVNEKVVREMERIVEEVEQGQRTDQPEKAQWGYRIPFAGVRYYSF